MDRIQHQQGNPHPAAAVAAANDRVLELCSTDTPLNSHQKRRKHTPVMPLAAPTVEPIDMADIGADTAKQSPEEAKSSELRFLQNL